MKKYQLFIPWLVVCIATAGSLFFSAVLHTAPCTLCWYQRVVMFPLAIILGIAAFRGAYHIVIYILPLALIGFAIAAYHVLLVAFFSEITVCAACTLKTNSLNPLTFPLLSLFSFLALNLLLIWIHQKHNRNKKL